MAHALPPHSPPDQLSDELLGLLEEIWQDLGGGAHSAPSPVQPAVLEKKISGEMVGPSPAELESLQEFLQFGSELVPFLLDCPSSKDNLLSTTDKSLVSTAASSINPDVQLDGIQDNTMSSSLSPLSSLDNDGMSCCSSDLTDFFEETLFDLDVDAFMRTLDSSSSLF